MLGDCPLLMVGRALFDGLFVTCGYTSAPSLLRRVSSSEGGWFWKLDPPLDDEDEDEGEDEPLPLLTSGGGGPASQSESS